MSFHIPPGPDTVRGQRLRHLTRPVTPDPGLLGVTSYNVPIGTLVVS